ncbi:MAG TPA: helix-turn-helix transcriptional regulator [Trinickia sp.]|uniref:helix-turn-helix transcriptional regulator n=1 Tax=Trinickia sp. TaxID=2571163 RepID=UPI002B51A0A9|nr:helix-turn-helix transcriptional regulator [Trinickia sp.]HTI18493.1 helix-turn-helix transcriptional regulator [Trinickia sp.]
MASLPPNRPIASASGHPVNDAPDDDVPPAAPPAARPANARAALTDTPARALGEFIRAHRERLTPLAVGLPPGPRRRTPGLRREEVAQLCGVSPTWYTWIEQGRPVSASADALARIAVALQLSRAERAYLFELAGERDPSEPSTDAADAPGALIATVDHLDTPAYVLDRQWSALAWNAPAAELFVGWLDGGERPAGHPEKACEKARERNLLHFTFLEPLARRLIVDWETRARRLVAQFRADSIRHLNDAPMRALIDALAGESEEFARFWASQDVGVREGGTREFDHPRHGHVVYEQITLKPAHREDLLLVVLIRQ